jgi:hypothetical protein
MRRSIINLSVIIIILAIGLSFSSSLKISKAAIPVAKQGDLIGFSYRLVAIGTLIEVKTEDDPEKTFLNHAINPPGLYDELLDMKLGAIKDAVIPPGEGFSSSDPTYGYLFNTTLYYNDLKVVMLNNVYYTDLNTNGFLPGSFGYYFIRIAGGLLGAAAVVFLVYGGYKLYPLILGKKCMICKTLAIGSCKKCGENFCEKCYSNGCPACKSRTLLRFKS